MVKQYYLDNIWKIFTTDVKKRMFTKNFCQVLCMITTNDKSKNFF